MQNGYKTAAELTIAKSTDLAAQRLSKELDEAITRNDFKSLMTYLDKLNDEKDSELFAKVINRVSGKISLFAKIVYVFPQNQKQWGNVITKMIIIGADVYANYSNSFYRIFDKLRRDADETYFYTLCNLLFNIALENNDSKKMLTLIADSPGLVPQIRYIKREKFYQVLLTKIFEIPEIDKSQSKATFKKDKDKLEQLEEIKISLQYTHLNELIRVIHPDNFAITSDKRRHEFAMLALRVRILQLAKKQKSLTDDDKIFIENILLSTKDFLPCMSHFFIEEYKKIVDPSSVPKINHNHQKGKDAIKLLNNISIEEDSQFYESFSDAIKTRNYDVIKLFCAKFPFHVFIMIDQNGKSLWDEIIKKHFERRNNSAEQVILIILEILKTKLNIKCRTLLPVACALGQLELVNYFLSKYSDELKYSHDIILAFEFAKYYHYYEIIAELLDDANHCTLLRVRIDLKEFTRYVGSYLYTITNVEGLQSIYQFVNISLRNFMDLENVFSAATDSELKEKLQMWESILFGLKSRSDYIKQSFINNSSATKLFDNINTLCASTFSIQSKVSIPHYNLVQEHKLTRQNIKKYPVLKAQLDEYSCQHLIHIIELNDHETAILLYRKFRHIIKNQKIGGKINEIIEALMMQIKFGYTVWEPLLLTMFKLAMYHIKSINLLLSKIDSGENKMEACIVELYKNTNSNLKQICNQDFIRYNLLYLISEASYNTIKAYIQYKGMQFRFNSDAEEQSFVSDSSKKFTTSQLDSQRRRKILIKDERSLDPNSLFQRQIQSTKRKDTQWVTNKPANNKWQPIYASNFATVTALSESNNYFEAYKNRLKFIKTIEPKFQIITAVKHNLPAYLQTLLSEASHKINDWPEIDQKAFYLSFENPNFSECATVFIKHLAIDKCDILLTAPTGKPSPAHYIEQHNKFDVQQAFLKKMIIFYSRNNSSNYNLINNIYVNLLYLAINLRLPNTLRNHLIYAVSNISREHLNIPSLFIYVLQKEYTDGIYIFIEVVPECLNNLASDVFDRLCHILIRDINNVYDIITFEKLFKIFKNFNQYLSNTKSKPLTFTFVQLAMSLKVLDIAPNIKLNEQRLNEVISEINLEYNLPSISKYLIQKLVDYLDNSKKHDGQMQLTSASKSNIYSDIETAMQIDNDAEFKGLIAKYPLHCIVVVTKDYEGIYDLLIKNNKYDHINFILLTLANLCHNTETSIVTLASELNYLKILKYNLEKNGHNGFIRQDIKYIIEGAIRLNHHEIVDFYLKLLGDSKVLAGIDKEIFYNYLSNLIISAKNLTTLYDIYNNIITIYKPLLPTGSNQSYTTEHFVSAFIGQLQEKVIEILDVTKPEELKLLATILSGSPNKTLYFYKALLKKINSNATLIKPVVYYTYLQKWLNILVMDNLLNESDLCQARIIRLVITEKYLQSQTSTALTQNTEIIHLPSELKLKPKGSKTNVSINDTIVTKNLKNHISTLSTEYVHESSFGNYDCQFLEHMMHHNSCHLIKMLVALVESYGEDQIYFTEEQKELCKNVINSLAKGIKIHQYFRLIIKQAMPILIRYKCDCILEIVNIIAITRKSFISSSHISNEFDPNLLSLYSANFLSSLRLDVFPSAQVAYSQSINVSYPISCTNEFNQYNSNLDGLIWKATLANGVEKHKLLCSIIKHLEMQTSINIHSTKIECGSEYLILETLLPDLIKCIELSMREVGESAIQKSYSINDLYLDETQSESFWRDSYRNIFGIPPLNSQNDRNFYQKLYKLTHLEFFSSASFNERFNYCLKHELIFAWQMMLKNVPILMNTTQLRIILITTIKLKYYESIPLILNYISPLDVFSVCDAAGNFVWDYISKTPDKDYIPIARLILTKIKEYIGADGENFIILAIKFGMGRLALALLHNSKINLNDNDIKFVFINAIHYREYEIVSFLVSTFNKKYPGSFNTDLDEFYAYFCDEVNLIDTMSNLNKIETKLHTIYKNIFLLDNKSSFFNSQNCIWLLCVEALDSRKKYFEEQFLANKNGLVRQAGL